MVKQFTLNNFNDEAENKNSRYEFVSFFNDPQAKKNDEQKTNNVDDVESKARRIFEEAYIQGEKAGYDMGMKKVEPLINRLNADIAALSAFKEDLLGKAEKMSVELAIIFAEAVVLKECHENREIVVDMAKKALEICEEKSGLTIRMRRDDIRYISEDRIYPLKVVPDDTLKEPGFIIESNFGDIDGTISVQIEELKKQFCGGHADR